mgnify:CR=1 FL=1
MESAIAVALITGGLSLLGTIIATTAAGKRQAGEIGQKLGVQQAVLNAKLDELTREVREHNNFARRVPVIEEQVRVANHRISDLEDFHKHG